MWMWEKIITKKCQSTHRLSNIPLSRQGTASFAEVGHAPFQVCYSYPSNPLAHPHRLDRAIGQERLGVSNHVSRILPALAGTDCFHVRRSVRGVGWTRFLILCSQG